MAKGKYIKVELKDGSKHVLLASNEAFYAKKGAKITEPTQEEIEAAFPTVKKAVVAKTDTDTPEYNAIATELMALKTEKGNLEKALADEKAKVKTLSTELMALKTEKQESKK